LRRHGHNTTDVIGAPTGSGTSKVEFGIHSTSPPWEYLHTLHIPPDLPRFTHPGEIHIMSTNRPFLANFLAAFRAQSTYKAASQSSTGTPTLSSAQISQSARAIATKAERLTTLTTTTTPTPHRHPHQRLARRGPCKDPPRPRPTTITTQLPKPIPRFLARRRPLRLRPPLSRSTGAMLIASAVAVIVPVAPAGSVMLLDLRSGILEAGHRLVKSGSTVLVW
jgi:hypothetical protein